eukprot:g7782.t1
MSRAYVLNSSWGRFVCPLLWLTVLLFGLHFAPKLLTNTTSAIVAPDGTQAYTANQKLAEFFPNASQTADVVLLVQALQSEDNVAYPPSVPSNPNGIATHCVLKANSAPCVLKAAFETTEKNIKNSTHGALLRSMSSYYSTYEMGSPLAANTTFLPKTGRSDITYALISYNNSDAKKVTDFVDDLYDTVKSPNTKRFNFTLTGTAAFQHQITAGVKKSLDKMDKISLPIALVVLALVIGSWRLLLIPILNIATSFASSFMIMYGISESIDVIVFAPSVMMSLIIALSIDYALFMLSRFSDELKGGASYEHAAEVMLATAGHVVLVSGFTLVVCFLGLCIFPLNLVRTIGIGAAVAIAFTMLINLSLTPALLFLLKAFFTTKKLECNCASTGGQAPSGGKKVWAWLANLTTTRPIMVLTVWVAVAIGVGTQATNWTPSLKQSLLLPRGSSATAAFEDMSNAFGAGFVQPYKLIVQPPTGGTVWNATFFKNMADVVSYDLTNASSPSYVPNTEAAFFTGITNLGEAGGVTLPQASACISHCRSLTAECFANNGRCALVAELAQKYVTPKHNAAQYELTLKIDPFAEEGRTWLSNMKTSMDQLQTKYPGYHFYLHGSAGTDIDAVDKVYDLFPTAIGITLAIVMVLIGGAFRTLAVPVRAVLSLSCMLAFVYGLATLVYVKGKWDGPTTPVELKATAGGINWFGPIMCFSILVGLGLDYDILLLDRVLEERRKGYSEKESVARAYEAIVPIVVAAGLIMIIAFSGLMASSQPNLNQIAFYLLFGVAWDTLVSECMIVPACMALLGKWNWWPRTFSESFDDMKES